MLSNDSAFAVRLAGYSSPIPAVSPLTPATSARQHLLEASRAGLGPGSTPAASGTGTGTVQIRLTDSKGAPLANAPVLFNVLAGSGGIAPALGGTLATQLLVRTDGNGLAKIYAGPAPASGGVVTVTLQTGEAANAITGPTDSAGGLPGFVLISLGGEPFGISDNGIITVLKLVEDDQPILARWRSGTLTDLATPPTTLYSYPNDTSSNLGFALRPDDPQQGLKLNRNGMIAAQAYDMVFNETITGINEEEFIAVWPADNDTPFAIKGLLCTTGNFDDSRQINHESFAYLLALDNGDGIWVEQYDPTSGYQPWLYKNGAAARAEVTPTDANAQHQTPQGGGWDLPNQGAGQVPLAINDAGQILADDDPMSEGFGAIPLQADVYGANVIQTCSGYSAKAPYVLTAGKPQYLLSDDSATAVRLSGFDEAGNVYGSLNPNYPASILLDKGVDVIWVADPVAWGLPAGTPPYTPILWMQPLLPGTEVSRYGVPPNSTRVQLGLTVSGKGFALVPARIDADIANAGQIPTGPGGTAPATTGPVPTAFWINSNPDPGAG